MATANKQLHYATSADAVALKDYVEKNGTTQGFKSNGVAGDDAANWLEQWQAMGIDTRDINAVKNQIDASVAYWGQKPKEKSNLTKAAQGLVRVAEIIPGPWQAPLNVADNLAKGKLSGHKISKNVFVNALAGAAGGAAGSALGTSSSTSMLNSAKAGVRNAVQDQYGLHPYERALVSQVKDGYHAYKGNQPGDPGLEYQGPRVDPKTGGDARTPDERAWGDSQIGAGGEWVPPTEYQGPRVNPMNGEDARTPEEKQYGDSQIGPNGEWVPPKVSGAGAGAGKTSSSGGGNNMFELAALGLLADQLKKPNEKAGYTATPGPYGQFQAGAPGSNAGLITNQMMLDDQRRRLAAMRGAA